MRPNLLIGLIGSLLLRVVPLAAADTDARQASWDVLDRAVHASDPDHRRQALAALATIPGGNDRAVKMAASALRDDKDPQVRTAAAVALGEMKAKQAAPELKAALDDKGEVAFAAAKALCSIGDPAGRDMLVAVLAGERSDSPGMLTKAVRDARKNVRHPQGILLMGGEDAAGAMFGPAGMGIAAVKDAFKMKGVSDRASAAQYLAKDPEPYAVSLLEWALTDNSWEVRASAAKALGERGNAESEAKLQLGLADTRDAVRTLSAASIIRIEDRGAVTTSPNTPR
jgi:HEAT repeat protein